jgi:hypothetical protein
MMTVARVLLCITTCLAHTSLAYEVQTHRILTRSAVNVSALSDRIREVGAPLGILSLTQPVSDGTLHFFGSYAFEIGRPVRLVIEDGAHDEDGGVRFLNHFHNPLAPAGQEGYSYLGVTGRPSLAWGLEPTPVSGQDLSLRDAREYLRQSIVAPAHPERKRNFVRLFKTLGHVAHLIEDLGQPQHTRNDSHGVSSFLKRGYEAFVNENLGDLPAGGYATVRMGRASDFWVTASGSGLANYSNRGFVTTGTNFTGTRSGNTLNISPAPGFPSPSGAVFSLEKVQITDLPFPQRPPSLIGEIWFVGTPVTDSYTGATDMNPRASTFSIFDEDLSRYGYGWTFTMNRFNFIEQRRLLAPRAIGYSAGLLDHFLRGKLRIEPPATGLYAYADQATAPGFPSLRVRVTNDTPGEALTGGTLVAAVTFHRNECYTANLFGEFFEDAGGNLVTPCPAYRSAETTHVLSAEQPLSLAAGETRELTLQLASPVPMDATDVHLQLLYRGGVGQEPEDFALGYRDLSEPTFLAVANGTDVFEIPGGFFPYTEIIAGVAQAPYSIVDRNANGVYDTPPDVDVAGGNIRYELRFGGTTLATIPALPEGRFSRLAVLANPGPISYQIASLGAGFNQVSSYTSTAKVNQLDAESGTYYVGTVHEVRGTRQWASVTYYRYYPTAQLELSAMPPSTVAGAADAVGMTITPPAP